MNRDDQLVSEPNKVVAEEEIPDDPNAPVDEDGMEPEPADELDIEDEDDGDNEIHDEDDIIDFDAKQTEILKAVGEELSTAVGDDYHDPELINDFIIESINEFGQVTAKGLPDPAGRKGDYVMTKATIMEQGKEIVVDLKILCSGVAWYMVPPQLDPEFVLLAAIDIEAIQNMPDLAANNQN